MSALKQGLSDLIRERRNGKVSSKKIWGHLIMILVAMTYIMDGYHFYTINETLFGYMLTAGTLLLGLNIVANMFKKTPAAEPEPTPDVEDQIN